MKKTTDTARALFDVTVVPKSSRSEIRVAEDFGIRVYLNSPPVEGKANEECIKLFAKSLGVPKSTISIDKGEKGRRKRILVEGLDQETGIFLLKKKHGTE